jgi:hypothetical protein
MKPMPTTTHSGEKTNKSTGYQKSERKMKNAHEEMRRRIKALTDEELVNMIDGNPQDYTEEGLLIARQEAESRGSLEGLYKKIENKYGSPQEQTESIAEQETPETPTSDAGRDSSPRKTWSFRSRTLKEETLLEEWSMLVLQGAGNAPGVLDEIQLLLESSKIPGECKWLIEEVKSSNLIFKTKREFLIVEIDQFKDYHNYICIRDYGVHLDCSRFLTVEPGFLKKKLLTNLGMDETRLSTPRNIMLHQDLQAWNTVVDYAVKTSVESLLTRLGQDIKLMPRESRKVLDIW